MLYLIVFGCTLVMFRGYICYLGASLDKFVAFVVFGHMLLYSVVFGRTWCDFGLFLYVVMS